MGLRHAAMEVGDELGIETVHLGACRSFGNADGAGVVLLETRIEKAGILASITLWFDENNNPGANAVLDVFVETATGLAKLASLSAIAVPTTNRTRVTVLSTDTTTQVIAKGRIQVVSNTPPGGGNSASFSASVRVDFGRAAVKNA